MRRGLLPATVCLVTAVIMAAWTIGPAAQIITVPALAAPDPIVGSPGLAGTLGDNGWYKSPVTVSLETTSSVNYSLNSGVNWTLYTGPFTLVKNSTYNIIFHGWINSTANQTVLQTVKIDYQNPFTNATFKDPRLTISGRDNVSGLSKTMFRIDEGNWTQWTYPVYEPTQGRHFIEYYSIDLAGNQEAVKNKTIKVTRDPIIKSWVNGTIGDNNWYTSAVTITLQLNQNIRNASANYTLDNATWIPYEKPVVLTFNGTTTIEIRGWINYTANDTLKFIIKIDCVKPVTNHSFADPVFGLSATDNVSGVGKMMFKVDDGKWWLYLQTYKPLEGSHVIQYYSIDEAGNKGDTLNVTVLVTPHTNMASAEIIIVVTAVGLAVFLFAIWRRPSGLSKSGEQGRIDTDVHADEPKGQDEL